MGDILAVAEIWHKKKKKKKKGKARVLRVFAQYVVSVNDLPVFAPH